MGGSWKGVVEEEPTFVLMAYSRSCITPCLITNKEPRQPPTKEVKQEDLGRIVQEMILEWKRGKKKGNCSQKVSGSDPANLVRWGADIEA